VEEDIVLVGILSRTDSWLEHEILLFVTGDIIEVDIFALFIDLHLLFISLIHGDVHVVVFNEHVIGVHLVFWLFMTVVHVIAGHPFVGLVFVVIVVV